VWFITGAGRGLGVESAKGPLAVGDAVVATGRNPEAVRTALGEAQDLLAVRLDVTSPQDAKAAVKAAVDRFGRIDVLVYQRRQLLRRLLRRADPCGDQDLLILDLMIAAAMAGSSVFV
jgi:hypothetical protein